MIIGGKMSRKAGVLRGGMALVCAGLVLMSCVTNKDPYQKIDTAVEKDDYQRAIDEITSAQAIRKGKKTPKKPIYGEDNQISMYLDKGLLEHYAGDYQSSYQDLTSAEQAIEAAYTKSVSADIASYVANDNTKEYAGEDYEDVYVNIFNALNAYHLKNGQAHALINDLVAQGGELQVLAEKYGQDDPKAKEFLEKAINAAGVVFSFGTIQWPEPQKITFTNSALARYLGAVFSLAEGNKDMARYHLFELSNAFSTPLYNGLRVPEALAVSGERGDETGPLLDIPQGKGQLNILIFAGLAPIKAETTVQIPFPSFQFPKAVPAALKVPGLVERPSSISSVKVSVEHSGPVDLILLEDMGAVITDTFNGHYSSVLAKTFARVLAKYVLADAAAFAAAQSAREVLKLPEIFALAAGTAVLNAAQAALNETESADVRMGRYLPSKAYIGAVNLDPGTYKVNVSYIVGGKTMDISKTVEVTAGKISLLEDVCLR
jgi:hypothetical protein